MKKVKTVWYFNGNVEHQFVEGQQPDGYIRGRKPHKLSEQSKQQMIENQKKHFLEKYGTEWPTQVKEVQEKRRKTTMDRYGVPINLNIPEVKSKAVKAMHSKEANEKRKQTNLERYGVENPYQAEEIKQIIKKTNLDRYGVENPYQQPHVKEKAIQNTRSEKAIEKRKQTNLERYNVTNYTQTLEYHKKSKKKYFYDNEYFDSSWELAVYIYYKDHNIPIIRCPITLNYVYNNKNHIYIPDFKINDELVEIKSDHFFENDKMINPYDRNQDDLYEAKHQCMIQNNVKIYTWKHVKPILEYMNNIYSKNWLTNFIMKEIK